MAKAKTLKDSDDAVIYPVSKSDLVYRADNTTTVEGALSSIEAAIDKSLVKDFSLDSNPSTTTVVLDKTYQNIKTGAEATGTVTFPVASATQAGVMNSSTFETIQDNADKIQAILNGSVAIEGLSANVTQPELTAAWKDATGRTELFNQASIYDVTNKKVWTYYDNEGIWRFVNAEGSVSVSQFTNSSLGTIKGSEVSGQVFAETDGTGSVNGWDTMTNQVSTNTSNIANEVTNRTNAVNDLQEQIDGKANAGDVHNGTLTINHNGEQKVAFSANTSIDSTISIDGVTSSEVISTESVTPIVTTGLIVDGAVTKNKIADYSVDNLKLADNSVDKMKIMYGAVSSDKISLQSTETGVWTKIPISNEFALYVCKNVTYPSKTYNANSWGGTDGISFPSGVTIYGGSVTLISNDSAVHFNTALANNIVYVTFINHYGGSVTTAGRYSGILLGSN